MNTKSIIVHASINVGNLIGIRFVLVYKSVAPEHDGPIVPNGRTKMRDKCCPYCRIQDNEPTYLIH